MRALPSEIRRLTLWTTAALLVGVGGAVIVSERVAPVYPTERGRAAWVEANGAGLDAAVFGASHAYGLDLDALGHDGTYLNVTSSDLFEARALLAFGRRAMPDLDTVYLAIPLDAQDNGIGTEWRERRRSVYAMTGRRRPISGDWRLAVTAPVVPLAREDHWWAVAARLRRGTAQPIQPIRPAPPDREPRPPAEIPAAAAEAARYHLGLTAQALAADAALCDRVADALDGFGADAHDLTVVLFTPPYPAAYRSPDRSCDVRAMARTVADASDRVVYVDASAMPLAASAFRDGSHLRPSGARQFSLALRDSLDARGVR